MNPIGLNRFVAVVLGGTLILCGGCAVLPLSTLGSIPSLGNSGVSVGRDHYFFGKLTTSEMARFDDVRAAVRAAAVDLSLRPKWPEDVKDGVSEMAFLDERDEQVGVRTERLSATLTRIRVDTGLLGPEENGRLFLMRVRAHLPRAAKEPSVEQS